MNKINRMCRLLKYNTNVVTNNNVLVFKRYVINTLGTDDNTYSVCQNQHILPKIKHIYKYWTKEFMKAGISEPNESIQFILAHVYNLNKVSDLYRKFSNEVDISTQKEIETYCKKRLLKMPVQYLLGEWHFRELVLKMEPPVFIPRPETEMLIDFILDDLKDIQKKVKMLDVCCGSGAISLALLKNNPHIEITAVDKNMEACNLTLKNATLHKLNKRIRIRKYEINKKNVFQGEIDKFDVIVSNPPYVPTEDIYAVQPEIRLYEDLEALDGGPDGLDIIKSIFLMSKEKLVPGGKLYLETDPLHPAKISHMLETQSDLGMKFVKCYKDFCNKDRFVKVEKI